MPPSRPATAIGASDVALLVYWDDVLAGREPPFSPYSNQGIVELYRRCTTGEWGGGAGNAAAGGKASEILLAAIAAEMLGADVVLKDEPVQSPDDPRWYCTPDCSIGGRWGIELKSVYDYRRLREWGTGAGAIPAAYYWQLQWSMLVCQVSEWPLVVRMATGFNAVAECDMLWQAFAAHRTLLPVLEDCKDVEVRVYQVQADPDQQRRIKDLVNMWYEFYVDIGVRPEPVGLDADSAALRALAEEGAPRLPDESELEIIDEIGEAKAWKDQWSRTYTALKQRLQVAAQNTGDTGIVDEDGRGGQEDSRGSFRVKGF